MLILILNKFIPIRWQRLYKYIKIKIKSRIINDINFVNLINIYGRTILITQNIKDKKTTKFNVN